MMNSNMIRKLRYDVMYDIINSFQTTLTPNPEKLYKYYSVTKQEETCF